MDSVEVKSNICRELLPKQTGVLGAYLLVHDLLPAYSPPPLSSRASQAADICFVDMAGELSLRLNTLTMCLTPQTFRAIRTFYPAFRRHLRGPLLSFEPVAFACIIVGYGE